MNEQMVMAAPGNDDRCGGRGFMAMMTKERQAPTPPLQTDEEDTAINHRRRRSKRTVDAAAKKMTSTTVPTARARMRPIVRLDVIVFG